MLKAIGFRWMGSGPDFVYLSKDGKQVIINGVLSKDLTSLPLLDDTTIVEGESMTYAKRFTAHDTMPLGASDFPRIPRIEYHSMPRGLWSDLQPIEYVDDGKVLKLAPWKTENLYREAKIISQLHHSNVVRLLSIVTINGCFAGFGMEELYGLFHPTIPKDRLKDQLPAFIQETVEYLHENQIYHCDIRPGNIMLTTRGRLKLVDFDLAQTDVLATPRTYIPHSRHALAISPRLDDLDVYMSVILIYNVVFLHRLDEICTQNQDLLGTALESFHFSENNNLNSSNYFNNVFNRIYILLRSQPRNSSGSM